jgi:hypothetical protein
VTGNGVRSVFDLPKKNCFSTGGIAMALSFPMSGRQLRSLIKKSGELEVSLASVEVLPPAPNEVVVRVEAYQSQ